MSRSTLKNQIPVADPALKDFLAYLLRQINRLKEERKRDENNIARLNEIVSLKFKVRHFEEEPEVAE